MTSSIFRRVFDRAIARHRTYHVYTTDAAQQIPPPDSRVEIFDAVHPAPKEVVKMYRDEVGSLGTTLMFNRLRRRGAVLLILREGGALQAYGWLQSILCLEREFWWLSGTGVCLGPYWTHPDCRGKGIYGLLLGRSLREAQARGWNELYIFAQANNDASNRGIQKAGFRSLGIHRIHTYLGGLIRRHWQVSAM